ncbi:ABC transporter permease/M1 family aminopeptidase [Pontibacter populi]|uniref:Peptidase M1 membrane alanine aminopeptidase domain-containing protein n=1 Tax=Pontibacter populi TaxID=890055 RepID=A0ABV1RYJ7_9BACT
MRFWGIFNYEFSYQLQRFWTWLIFIALVGFGFLFVRVNFIADALYSDSFVNTPFFIAGATVMGCLIWLGMSAVVAGEAAARDVQTRMHPLTYTAPISKLEYLGGRFCAALVLNGLIILAVQAGILLGYYAPGVDPGILGPFRPAAYFTAYAYIALPNAIIATAIQFSLAVRSGKAMASYLGSFLLVFLGFFVAGALLWKRSLGILLDPIGIRFIVEDLAHLWTTAEQSTRLIGLEGNILTNRLLWLSVALVALSITYFGFHFAHRIERSWWNRILRRQKAHPQLPTNLGVIDSKPVTVSQVARTFGLTMHVRKTLAFAWDSFRTIETSWAGLAMLVAIPLMTVLIVADQMVSGGMPLVPVTARVISVLTAPLSAELSRWVIIPLLLIFFAGELVWREREARLGEITDTTPGSEWPPLLGKFLGLSLVLVVFTALQMGAGILAQLLMGYQNFEIGLYVKTLFGLQLPEYLLFALLALVVHVLVNQKYVGYLVAIIVYVFIAISSMFRIEHNLLVYGAGPAWSYTDMGGFGSSIEPWLWFKAYWAAWALLLAVVARLIWVRGKESNIKVRLQLAKQRFTPSTAWIAAVAAMLLFILGGFIFYNTNVLNNYQTASEINQQRAEYERRYGKYKSIAQPQLAATTLHVEIYPDQRAADITGTYRLVNRSTVAIDSIHVATVPRVKTKTIAFDRSSAKVLTDEELGYQIYKLEKPLQPDDMLQLKFQVQVVQRGYRESGADAPVVANGTYFSNEWLPAIGYQESRELMSSSDRRDQGLSSRPMIASLYDEKARKGGSGGLAFEAVVGTAEDQVPVAPGALHRTWQEGNRRYFHYATDAAIGNELYFFSARYKVHEAQWKNTDNSGHPVAIRVYHHPEHTTHLEGIVRSIKASLDYYTNEFGPYRHKHVSFVEYPGDGDGAGIHAEPGLLFYEEGFTFLKPEEPKSFDFPFAVVAHEMAHQWTVPYANVEGAPVMSESIAWYYAMKAVENALGPGQLRQLINFMRESNVRAEIRRGEPLLRGLDPYMSYRKGPFALYTMSEYVGTEKVNHALRQLLEKHRITEAAPATTLDLYRELQAVTPDSLQYLLYDLFEVNTYWDLETKQATAEQTKTGQWQVTLEVKARKEVSDSAGVETEVPVKDWVMVGVLEEGKSIHEPLYLKMYRIHSGEQTIKVTVPRKPARAGIDPNNLLIDSDTDNNMKEVKIEATGRAIGLSGQNAKRQNKEVNP